MMIGDVHSSQRNASGSSWSIEQLYDHIAAHTPGPIPVLTEGGRNRNRLRSVDTLRRRQAHAISHSKFAVHWCDWRFLLPTYKLHLALSTALRQVTALSRGSELSVDEVKQNLRNVVDMYKELKSFGANDFVRRCIERYHDYAVVFDKLDRPGAIIVRDYNRTNVGRDFEAQLSRAMRKLVQGLGAVYAAVTSSQFTRPFHDGVFDMIRLVKLCSKLENAVFESYVLSLMLSVNASITIIHLGQNHVDALTKWMTRPGLNFERVYAGKELSHDRVDVTGF